MIVVRWLERDVAEDLALAPAVTDVVNRAYAHKEVGLFATKIERTNVDDVHTSISRRETAVALLGEPSSARSAQTRWMTGPVGLVRSASILRCTAEGSARRSSGSWRTTRRQLGEARCSSRYWSPNRYILTFRESGSGTSDAGTARRHASHSWRCTRRTRRGCSCQ